MCDYPNREAAMTPLRWNDGGTPTVWCDPCIAPLIEALNAGGVSTVASCCGHNGKGSDGEQTDARGWVMLRDGSTLLILPDLETRTAPVVADLIEQARAEERERIAQAIEAENESFGVSEDPYGGEYDRGAHQGLSDAARIARHTPEDGA